MPESRYMKKSEKLLKSVRGRALTVEERREASVELASYLLNESRRIQTNRERKTQVQVARMLRDSAGKTFALDMTDQCFRSTHPSRIADQLVFLLNKHGVPHFLPIGKRIKLLIFKWLGNKFPRLMVPFAKRSIRKETAKVIFPGERRALKKHIKKRKRQGVRINVNHLGEAILGEEEANRRLKLYLNDLTRPEVEYISVKVSSICSQIHILAWEETLVRLTPRLKQLYHTASQYSTVRPDGKRVSKFVNLDMEEYNDLHLTVELFRRVLDDPEFHHHSAGLVLQAYLPESYLIQQELTVWAKQRVAGGGAPIKIRIVKGANLAMEALEASLMGWPQAPYNTKEEVDANFKRMLHYGLDPENAWAVHIGIGSHNLFDIAYALLLREEKGVNDLVGIEMLEGMAPAMQRVVKALAGDLLLYCPAAMRSDFQHAVAYLIRRLDENSAPENFLRHLFKLMPGTKLWQQQANLFSYACHHSRTVSMSSNRTQNRVAEVVKHPLDSPFLNDPMTDWSIAANRKFAEEVISYWSQRQPEEIPEADSTHVKQALAVATKEWSASLEKRSEILAEVAHLLRCHRGDLMGAMVAETKKTLDEADTEMAEAIDFVEYYRRSRIKWEECIGIEWHPKGTVVVASPWNFPCSIATGGIAAALMAGNRVIFKPAPEARLVGWHLVQLFWKGGVSQEVLQYLPCGDDPAAANLVQDDRSNMVVLTGAADTAKTLLKYRPGIDLVAETGGKNALIITSLADRDLAVHDLVASVFGHAGQKCSACSLAILEAELYDDPKFMQQLRDSAESLIVGSSFDLATRLNPLIKMPSEVLKRGFTTLEEGEKWLLEPKEDPEDLTLWSPGIKLGVKAGSFMHQTELFGPLLGVMRADNLEHAIELANGTPYGLTAGLHSLDEREHAIWKANIEAGNLYINRGMTGAIVQRQPFGGCKDSCFGPGHKAGGPNYITQFMLPQEVALPEHKEIPEPDLEPLTQHLKKSGFADKHLEVWRASIGSYAYAWKRHFTQEHDPTALPGQENLFYYKPRPILCRVHPDDDHFNILRVIAAAVTCGAPIEVSGDPKVIPMLVNQEWPQTMVIAESDLDFIQRIQQGICPHVRLLQDPPLEVLEALAEAGARLLRGPIVSQGSLELLHHVQEVALSRDVHRYGHLPS